MNTHKYTGKQSCCDECRRRYRREMYAANKARFRSYVVEAQNKKREVVDKIKIESGCADCDYRGPAFCYDFDHVRGNKLFAIATGIVRQKSLQEILNEIEKCDVVCAICHRIRTHNRREPASIPSRIRRLTEDEKTEISVLYAEGGHTHQSLGELYSVNPTTIRNAIIKKGKIKGKI